MRRQKETHKQKLIRQTHGQLGTATTLPLTGFRLPAKQTDNTTPAQPRVSQSTALASEL